MPQSPWHISYRRVYHKVRFNLINSLFITMFLNAKDSEPTDDYTFVLLKLRFKELVNEFRSSTDYPMFTDLE